jgi:glycerophosphoryl diester phosphodiesterase
MTTINLQQAADAHFATLDRTVPDQRDYDLAVRHAPRIRFDQREPFLPSVVGYTVFSENAPSRSFPRQIVLPANATYAVEYAIWWDWEIQHLYELEHIWVYLDADEQVVAADASWHGGHHEMLNESGHVPMEDGSVIVYSEPGKHAFAPTTRWLLDRSPTTLASCGKHSGKMGVHVTPLFEGIIHDRTPLNNRVVHAYMERLAFTPAFNFSNVFDLQTAIFVPWENLFHWIPKRVKWWSDTLRETTPPHERHILRIAHRGASAYAQENSSASVKTAAELGADMVEVDIRLTADDVPVIAHDADLKRVFGVEGMIEDLTAEQLRAITPPDRQPVMTFDEMVDLCASLSMGMYLDIKEINEAAFGSVTHSLQRRGMLPYVTFGSFRPDFIAEIKHYAPQASTSILFGSANVDPVLMARALTADYVHPCWERLDSPSNLLEGVWLERVRAAGLGVICWNEIRPSQIASLYQLGVDGICSDQPELLLQAHAAIHQPHQNTRS